MPGRKQRREVPFRGRPAGGRGSQGAFRMRQKLRNDRPAGPGPYAEASAEVTYYTDPLCCWSWAFEPVRIRLVQEYGSAIA